MRSQNRRRDREQGLTLRENEVDTSQLRDGVHSLEWRYFL